MKKLIVNADDFGQTKGITKKRFRRKTQQPRVSYFDEKQGQKPTFNASAFFFNNLCPP